MTKSEQVFIERVWEQYRLSGRHDLPWRKKSHLKPYDILVSEIMLQQTQVDRVVPKYLAFMRQWPTAAKLAAASLGDVLRAWQGLGYNRRAKSLHECAKLVTSEQRGRFPQSYDALLQLPGIGPYTAGAVRAFAFNQPTPIIETNIRTVYLHHFFKNKTAVDDTALLRKITKTLDQQNPREWYWALMDYGAYLKKELKVKNTASKHYVKQSAFKGSDREIRGAILRAVADEKLTKRQLEQQLNTFTPERVGKQLDVLVTEGLVVKQRYLYQLP